MKKYSYEQLEAMMFKAHEDAQNGLETDLGRQVRESLESQEKQALAPSELVLTYAKHVAKRYGFRIEQIANFHALTRFTSW